MSWVWAAQHPWARKCRKVDGTRVVHGSAHATAALLSKHRWFFEKLHEHNMADLGNLENELGLQTTNTYIVGLLHISPGCILDRLSILDREEQLLFDYWEEPQGCHTLRINSAYRLVIPKRVVLAQGAWLTTASAGLAVVNKSHVLFKPAGIEELLTGQAMVQNCAGQEVSLSSLPEVMEGLTTHMMAIMLQAPIATLAFFTFF